MKVSSLIQLLQGMPSNAQVNYVWDGAARSRVEHVWLSRSGQVMLADCGDTVYSSRSQPENAPEDSPWNTPVSPMLP